MKKIAWEHLDYKLNYSSNIVEQETSYDDHDHDHDHDDDDDNNVSDLEEYEDEFKKVIKIVKSGTLVNTPYGLFNIKDVLNPMKQFIFWMGHTNFNLTEEVINTIAMTSGVEKLRPMTRYRFIIAIGKAFDFKDVRKDIEKQLLIEDTEILQIREIEDDI